MPKQPRAYYRPESIPAALELLAQPDTCLLGGGTKLLATEEGLASAVIDLQAAGLHSIELTETHLKLGAMARLTEVDTFLAQEAAAENWATFLQEAIRLAGPNTYRQAATMGGTTASRLAESELLAALLVLDASLTLWQPEMILYSLQDYLSGELSGLISALSFPIEAGKGRQQRVARTPKDTPIVSVCAWQPENGPLRLAATGIAAYPLRLTAAEAALADGLSAPAIQQAAAKAKAACRHPGDFRGDAAYRAEMTAVLCRRVCTALPA